MVSNELFFKFEGYSEGIIKLMNGVTDRKEHLNKVTIIKALSGCMTWIY
jgi:hypothetical protein